MDDLWSQLAAPFPADEIQWRVGSTTADKSRGLALAYIDARSVMDRLDAVVGPAHWRDSYRPLGTTLMCLLELRVPNPLTNEPEWIGKEDGAGASDVEPEKGTISDAFKRAAVKWRIGRYLYSLPSQWVDIDHGRIKSTPKLPAWALPSAHQDHTEASPALATPPSDDMTPDQVARYVAAIDKLANDYFDVFAKALETVGFDLVGIKTILSKKAAKDAITRLTAECERLLPKAGNE